MELRLTNIDETISSIKKYVYGDDYLETEIVCPYCNSEFCANIGDEAELEVECPECHNIVELDMNSDNIEEDHLNRSCCGGQCRWMRKL